MIARRARQAGIGHVHAHQYRHTYAATFLDNGGTESALMRQAGWRSRKVMERYTKPPPKPAPTAKPANSTSATASDEAPLPYLAVHHTSSTRSTKCRTSADAHWQKARALGGRLR
jgi:hypothetical protein